VPATEALVGARVLVAPAEIKTLKILEFECTGEEVPAAEVPVGARVLVAPGQRVPADGLVLAGASAADESMLTGEAAPVDKGAGDKVLGGTVNAGDATLEVGAGSPLPGC
jgi:P-type E1-E2 ATPase